MDIIALIVSIISVIIGIASLAVEIIKIKRENKKRNNRPDANQDG